MKKFLVILFLFLASTTFGAEFKPGPFVYGNIANPLASVLFQLNSTTQGMLFPTMTTIERDAIAAPANGLTVYNTDVNKVQTYDSGGVSWISLGLAGGGFTAGSVIFAAATGEITEDNANFFYNDGTNTLQVQGSNVLTTDNTETVTNKSLDADSNTITNIEDADIKAAANIARSKLASGTINHVIINSGTGAMSSEAQLANTRGGTGVDSSAFSGVAKVTAGVWSAAALNLATEVTGVLPLANGGSAKALVASAGSVAYSDLDSIEFSSVGTAGQPLLSSGTAAPTWFAGTGILKATGGVLTTGNISLTSEVTGTLPIANGGTNSSTALTGDKVVVSTVGGAIVESASISTTELGLLDTRTYIPNAVGVNNQVAVFDGVNSIDSSANFTFDGSDLSIKAQGNIILEDTAGGENVSIQANSTTTTYALTMPASQGGGSQALVNDGAGNLFWASVGAESVSTKSVSYTILDGDGFTTILVDNTTVDRTITLPTLADNQTRVIRIVNISTDGGTVTVDGEGAEKVAEATTVDLDFESSFIVVQGTATTWAIVAQNTPLNSEVKVRDGNGWGGTATKIRRFITTVVNTGSDITYADSGTLGATFTINHDGIYAIGYTDNGASTSTCRVAISIDADGTEVTQEPNALTDQSKVVAMDSTETNGGFASIHFVGALSNGNIVRPHTSPLTCDSSADEATFFVVQLQRH